MSVKLQNLEDHMWTDIRGTKLTPKSRVYYTYQLDKKEHDNITKTIHTRKQAHAEHELAVTITKPRNTTYDRFQIINARKEPHESLETFYSRLRQLGATAAFGAVEQDLVKDFFIGKMNDTVIQMELISEGKKVFNINENIIEQIITKWDF